MIPAQFDYLAPTTIEEALAALAEHRGRRQDHRRGAEPAPGAPDAAERSGDRDRPRQDRGAARRPRRRRRDRHRRHHHPPRGAQERPGPRQRVRDHQGRRAARRPAGAAPRYLRRRAGARRPGRRPRCAVPGAGRRVRDRRQRRRADRGGRRLLPRPVRHRDRGGRDPQGGPHSQAGRLGRPLREVRAGGPPVADRGRGRGGQGRGRHHQRGPGGADQHGVDAAARPLVEAALVGRPATDEAVRAAAQSAAEGTNPPSDLNGDADYRRHLVTVLTRRAVLAAAGA